MKVPELRRRILFTLAMIVVVRLGVQIPLPGIDVMELQKVIEASANASGPGAGLATVLTIFSGGGLQQCGIFALGIMPYISASIMTQLLSAVVPQWAKMVREEGGRQKMTKWTRAIAIVIALVQGWFLVGTLEHPERLQAVGLNIPADCQLVIDPGIQFALMTVLIMVAGTMFLMWIATRLRNAASATVFPSSFPSTLFTPFRGQSPWPGKPWCTRTVRLSPWEPCCSWP